MRIAACIVLYHPDSSDLEKNIRAISDHIDLLFLWRNSIEKVIVPENLSCRILWMGDGTNQYIAHPLNCCLSYCIENGFDYLLTMDQDSEFEDFGRFIETVSVLRNETLYRRTIIFAPNINHRYDISYSFIAVESTITSGSLCDVRAAIAIGGFREAYQIYWVDGEFCHRAHLNGYDIFTLTENNLKQQFGKITMVHGVTCYNYSAQSYYFLFRNMLWMHREYKTNPSRRCILYSTQMYIKGILIGENEKWKKLKAIWKGVYHGITRSYRDSII